MTFGATALVEEERMEDVTCERPMLRYHGGKWVLAPKIISYFPEHRIYVEPFGGAASVLLRKKRSYAEVYNDLNGEVVNLFKVVRDRGEELRRLVELTPFSREEYALSFERSEDSVEQARRTLVRSFMGFGSNSLQREIKSGFRANSNRSGTTPAHDWMNYADALEETIKRLRGVVIENRDALEVMARHDSVETLHYVDPPYVHSTRSGKMNHGHGYDFEMTDEEHAKLAGFLNGLKGAVILSGYRSELYDRLYAEPEWSRVEMRSLADGARERVEVLWLKNVRREAELPL